MEVSGNSLYWPTARIFLALTSPIQSILTKDCVTHSFCNNRAVEILYNDHKKTYARLADMYLEDLNKGVNWADTLGKNMSHFFIPQIKRGLGRFSNAAWECNFYFNRAIRKWSTGQHEKAFFYLGAATHLVQDLCVPHHAKGVLMDGHQEYENWAEAHRMQYLAEKNGLYNIGENPVHWVLHNALTAEKQFQKVCQGSTDTSYDSATQILLPQAQRTTAGFLTLFLDNVTK